MTHGMMGATSQLTGARSMTLDYDAQVRVVGQGPLLIYVPGMDGTGLLFFRQVPLLTARMRVLTYRLRDEAESMDQLVADLHALVTAHGDGEKVILIGESFGGALTLSYAARHADMLHRIVVLNTFAWFAPQWRLRMARLGIQLMPWGAMALVRRISALRLHSPLTAREDMARFFTYTAQATKRGYLRRLGILQQYDIRGVLPSITTPTLLLAADEDHLIPSVSEATKFRAAMPNATMQILAGYGHSCFLSDGIDMARILADWNGGVADQILESSCGEMSGTP